MENKEVKPHKKIIDKLAAYLIRFLTKITPLLGSKICEKASEIFGSFFYEHIPIRKKEIRENIKLSNLNISEERINSIIRRIYEHQFMNLIEVMRIKTMNEDNVDSRITFSGLEYFDKALEAGKGAILLTAHFGSWEYLGAALSRKGYVLHNLARIQSGDFDTEITHLRTFSGNKVVDRNKAARKVIKLLKENQIVGFISDQHSDNMGYEVEFLGRKCMATGGPIAFALKNNTPVIPAAAIRVGFEKYEVRVLPPIGLEKTGDNTRDIHEGTRKYTKVIENFVREYPEQWFWFHRRWKS